MSLKEAMNHGDIYEESGFSDPVDIAYAEQLAHERLRSKRLSFKYNQTDPDDEDQRQSILHQLFKYFGKHSFIEGPVYTSYGNHTTIGDDFYANFNLTIVDDVSVEIGNHVMFGLNVMISVTGHPLNGRDRRHGAQFSKSINIGDDVWIGGNVSILPGVSIGSNAVIGAGSVVTHDIANDSVALGTPARIVKHLEPINK